MLIVFVVFIGLPSGNQTATGTLTTGESVGTHGGVARGSSLPYDKDEPSTNFIEQLTKLNKLEMIKKKNDVSSTITTSNIVIESVQPDNKLEHNEKKDEKIEEELGKEEIVENSSLVTSASTNDEQIPVLEEKDEKAIHSSGISEVAEKSDEIELEIAKQLIMDVSGKSDNEQIPVLDEKVEKMISPEAISTIEGDSDKKEVSEKSSLVSSEKSDDEQISILEEKDEKTVDSETEFRLTMIRSVREAVNRICEQAVERTTEIVKSGQGHQKVGSGIRSKRDTANDSDAEFSDFSLPPPPLSQSTTTIGDPQVSL